MKCFSFFKYRQSKSAPELNHELDTKNGQKSSDSLPSPRSIQEMYKEREGHLKTFSYTELREATNNFSKLLKIGEGGFGSVYKGVIKGGGNNTVVAVKKLNTKGLQGHKEWLAEVQFLGVVDHPNLVKLLGYCSVNRERGVQRLLVYEYMKNRSLEDHLFSRASDNLPWKTRLDIILGAARGLAYLHEGMEVQVIFRDFKPSNVLLDVDLRPKLSDFGLAREGPVGDKSHVSTGVYGTLGYADPGYVDSGHLTVKSDIYSFGVVLYEILTGRRTIERFRPQNEKKLLEWVKKFPVDSDMFSMIVDSRVRNEYSLSSARKIAKLAESCLNKNVKQRPKMSEVVKILEEVVLQDLENGSTSKVDSNKQLFSHQVGARDIERKDTPLPPPRDIGRKDTPLPPPRDTSIKV